MFRVRTRSTGVGGSPYYTNHYFNDFGSTAQQCADAVNIFWNSMRTVISSQVNMDIEDEVAVINAGTGLQTGQEQVVGAAQNGTSGVDLLPNATQGLIRWSTGVWTGGRQVKGKTFVFGPTETHSTNGIPTPAYTGLLQTAALGLIADTSTELVIYSPTHLAQFAATTASAWGQWAVLRSRRD